MGEGGLAERREENTGEKGGEEGVPPDHSEVVIFSPFLKPENCAWLRSSVKAIMTG